MTTIWHCRACGKTFVETPGVAECPDVCECGGDYFTEEIPPQPSGPPEDLHDLYRRALERKTESVCKHLEADGDLDFASTSVLLTYALEKHRQELVHLRRKLNRIAIHLDEQAEAGKARPAWVPET